MLRCRERVLPCDTREWTILEQCIGVGDELEQPLAACTPGLEVHCEPGIAAESGRVPSKRAITFSTLAVVCQRPLVIVSVCTTGS